MPDHTIPPSRHETIREKLGTQAKPPTTVEELLPILRELAENLRDGAPTIAGQILLDDLAGRTEQWEEAVDATYLGALEEAAKAVA